MKTLWGDEFPSRTRTMEWKRVLIPLVLFPLAIVAAIGWFGVLGEDAFDSGTPESRGEPVRSNAAVEAMQEAHEQMLEERREALAERFATEGVLPYVVEFREVPCDGCPRCGGK